MTADATLDDPVTIEAVLARYAESVLTAAQVAPRMERGLFVMTAHQAKGKEFDAVVIADASARFWPDNDERRRLWYVALTRAAHSLTLIAPDSRPSPLLALCTD
jgi:superfamily I DNA/RNA helicase